MEETYPRSFVEGLFEIYHRKLSHREKQIEGLRSVMIEALENCETCRGESNRDRLCARCQTFMRELAL